MFGAGIAEMGYEEFEIFSWRTVKLCETQKKSTFAKMTLMRSQRMDEMWQAISSEAGKTSAPSSMLWTTLVDNFNKFHKTLTQLQQHLT